MRNWLAIFTSLQMVIAPMASADDSTIPPTTAATANNQPAAAPPARDQDPNPAAGAQGAAGRAGRPVNDSDVDKPLECRVLKTCKFFKPLMKDAEARKRINEQLTTKNGGLKCQALYDKRFLEELMAIYDARLTEGNSADFCAECADPFRTGIAQSSMDSTKASAKAILQNILCNGVSHPAPAERVETRGPDLGPAIVERPPREIVEREPVYRRRPAPPPEDEDRGGGGSFMNSNLMWGLGGLAIGGILGYMIGKNSAQQPQYTTPYWQQLGPRPPPFGQVPPYGGGFAQPPGYFNRYPVTGVGGNGPPMILPYQGPTGAPGAVNYNPYGTGVGVGGYNLGTGFSNTCGFCSTNGAAFNTGAPPIYLPAH